MRTEEWLAMAKAETVAFRELKSAMHEANVEHEKLAAGMKASGLGGADAIKKTTEAAQALGKAQKEGARATEDAAAKTRAAARDHVLSIRTKYEERQAVEANSAAKQKAAARDHVLGIRARYERDEEKKAAAAAKKAEKEAADASKEAAERREEALGKLKSLAGGALGVATAFAAASAAMVGSGIAYGIELSDASRKQQDILRMLTYRFGGAGRGVEQGDVALQVTMSLAGEKGVPPAEAMSRVKRLIDAKFGRADTEMIFRVAADLSEVRGADKAEAFVGQMEELQRIDAALKDKDKSRIVPWQAIYAERGQAEVSALERMRSAGIQTTDILKLLAKKGEDLRDVNLRLRRGQVEISEFSHAVATAAGRDLGNVAGKGLEAEINRLKIGFSGMFTGWDLSPLDDAAKTVNEILKGPEGNALKDAIKDVGNAGLELFKVFGTDSGKQGLKDFFEASAEVAKTLASTIREVKAEVQTLANWHAEGGIFSWKNAKKLVGMGGGEEDNGFETFESRNARIAENRKHLAEVEAEQARASGKAISDGMAKGVEDNAPKVAEAVKKAVGGAIEAGNEKAGINSPSTVAAEQGKFYDQGWEQGIERHAGGPERAAGRMADRIVRGGAASGGSAGGGTGSAGGAPVYTFAPAITVTGENASAVKSAVHAALAESYPHFLAMLRQARRDAREMVTP